MKDLSSRVRAAVDKYNMIDDGDRVAVGVSGGKDSMFLLTSLCSLSNYYPSRFTVTAVTVDPCFNGRQGDYSEIQRLCDKLGIEYIIRRSSLATIIFDEKNEKNPCSLCARMRRGILHNICVENGINKIALGHHMDDAVQTYFMNLLRGGTIGCFSPKTYLSRKNITMIRPLIFCEEKDIIKSVAKMALPIVKSECPVDGITARKDAEILISRLDKDYGDIKKKIMGAMQKAGIDGW